MGVTQTTRSVQGDKVKCYIGVKKKKDLPEGIPNIYLADQNVAMTHPVIQNPYYIAQTKKKDKITLDKIVEEHKEISVVQPKLTWEDRDHPVFAQILGLAIKYPKEIIEFGDVYEPLINKVTKKDLKIFFQDMIQSKFIKWKESKEGYVYIGRLE